MIKLARLALLALAMLATLFSKTGFAFDGNRAGFILGIGPGIGYARNDLNFATESKFTVKTDFLIGFERRAKMTADRNARRLGRADGHARVERCAKDIAGRTMKRR